MGYQLKDTEKVTFTATGINAVGNKVPVIYGPANWSVTDTNLLDLVPIGNFQCSVVTKGPLGTCQLKAQAWADSEKTIPIEGVRDIDVVASPATALMLESGPPEIR